MKHSMNCGRVAVGWTKRMPHLGSSSRSKGQLPFVSRNLMVSFIASASSSSTEYGSPSLTYSLSCNHRVTQRAALSVQPSACCCCCGGSAIGGAVRGAD